MQGPKALLDWHNLVVASRIQERAQSNSGAATYRHDSVLGFVNAPIWVTPERDEERYAAGTYSFIGGSGDGLPRWTKANRNLVDRDIVLWYTLGVTHVPRVEEWLVMPAVQAGRQCIKSSSPRSWERASSKRRGPLDCPNARSSRSSVARKRSASRWRR